MMLRTIIYNINMIKNNNNTNKKFCLFNFFTYICFMSRKKVKSTELLSTTPKERVKESKKIITPNNSKPKWNKIKGVEGEIVRFKTDDPERQLFLKDKNFTFLSVGVDNDNLYFYYSIKT